MKRLWKEQSGSAVGAGWLLGEHHILLQVF